MFRQSRSLTILFDVLAALGLVLALVGCAGPAPATPPALTPTQGARALAAPAVPMTDKEMALFVEAQENNPQAAASRDQCDEILRTEPWCSILRSVKQITRPEWDQLLPETQFYLGEYERNSTGDPPSQTLYALYVEHDGQRYTPRTYDQLLTANGVTFTDDNRELVARAWALMTIEDYLGDEVVFTGWENVEMPEALHNFNYSLYGWTRTRGLQLRWWFVFEGPKIKIASGPGVQQSGIGEYSISELPDPLFQDYTFYVTYYGQ